MLYIIFQYGKEPVLIHWILIGFKAMLKKVIYFSCSEVGMEGNNNTTYTTTHTNNFSSGEQSCPNFAETNNNNKVELLLQIHITFQDFKGIRQWPIN